MKVIPYCGMLERYESATKHAGTNEIKELHQNNMGNCNKNEWKNSCYNPKPALGL
jgi:hypothetical protein